MFGRKKRNRNADTDEQRTDSQRSRSRQRLKKPRRWPYVFLMFAALLFFLPNLVGWLGLHQAAINYFAADVRGSIQVDQFSAGWLQPVELSGIRIIDDEQQTVLTADKIQSNKTMFAMATGNDYGVVRIDQPIVFVQMSPSSSNVEDAFVNYLRPTTPTDTPIDTTATSTDSMPKVELNIVDGQVQLAGMDPRRSWKLDSINGRVQTGSADAPLMVELAARVTPQALDNQGQPTPLPPGALTLIGQIDAGASQLTMDSIDVALETKRLPMSVIGPAIERVLGPTAVSGTMSGNLQGNFSASDQSIAISVRDVDCRETFFACPSLIDQDQVQIQSMICNGDLQLTPRLVSANEFRLKSDLGRVRANGNFDVQQISQLGTSGLLLDSPFEMDGQLDLARMITMLPSTLQLHQDLDVQSGSVTFQVNSRNSNGTRRLVVNMDTANLAASRSGKQIVWAKPLRLVGTIAEQNQQLAIENIRCESDFLNITGQGNLREAQFDIDGDLKMLTERVGQFVDLDGTSLAGLMKGNIGWRLVGDIPANNTRVAFQESPIQITGNFAITNPVIESRALPRWAPNEIQIGLTGVGLTKKLPNQSTALQLNEGRIQMDLGSEQAIAVLAQPVSDAFTSEVWLAQCLATGNLNRWLAHLKNFVDLGPINGDGQMSLRSNVTLGPSDIQFQNTEYRFNDFRFAGYGIQTAESSVEGDLNGRYVYRTGALEIPALNVVADSISARGQNLVISYPNQLRINGDVAYRANVNRVADWIELSPTDESIFWFGDAQGTVNFASDATGINLTIDTDITDMAAATQVMAVPSQTNLVQTASSATKQWNALWQDANVKLTGGIKINHNFDALTLNNAAVQCSSLSGIVSGKVDDLYQSMNLDVTGAWQPDWNKINGLLNEMTGGSLKFTGKKPQRFTIRGPLFMASPTGGSLPNELAEPSITQSPTPWVPKTLFANATVGWDAGEVLGLPVGSTDFKLALNESVAQLSTDGIPFAGGIIQMSPTIDFRTTNPELKLVRTRLVDNVQLRPETAREWLKYVAPLAAEATSAEGNLTIDVATASVPLLSPEDLQASGTVQLTQAAIGAGPLAEQLLDSVKQIRKLLKPEAEDRNVRTTLRLKDQSVPFLIQDERVYHKQVDFTHKDVSIRTSGSVGFDQTLQMTASIPIADDWIDGEKYLAGLKGQSITIPIGGTVAQPQIDKSVVAQLSQDLIKQAASSAAQQAVQEKLTPKINQYQQKFNDKINGGLNKLQGKLQEGLNKNLGLDKLGIGPSENSGGGFQLQNLLPGQRPPTPNQPQAKPDAKDLLKKGLGELFK